MNFQTQKVQNRKKKSITSIKYSYERMFKNFIKRLFFEQGHQHFN